MRYLILGVGVVYLIIAVGYLVLQKDFARATIWLGYSASNFGLFKIG